MDHAIDEDLQHVLAGEAVSSIDVIDISDVRMHPGGKWLSCSNLLSNCSPYLLARLMWGIVGLMVNSSWLCDVIESF